MKTTKLDFEKFKAACLKWQQKLGMVDWKLYFYHKKLDGEYARISRDDDGNVASVTMSAELPKVDYKDFDPEMHAKHEMLHLFVNRMGYVARCRYVRPDDIDDTEEGMIRVLEKLI